MKKHNPFKTQNAMVALALTLASLNAAEQKTGLPGAHQDPIVPVSSQEYDERRLIKEKVIAQLSQGMNDYDKASVIKDLAKINSIHYADFINAVDHLSQGNAYNKRFVILTLVSISPEHYPAFIETVNGLSQGMDYSYKAYVISVLAEFNPDHYVDFLTLLINSRKR